MKLHKIAYKFIGAKEFYNLYKLLKKKELLISLGSMGVLIENKFPHFEVSIVVFSEPVDKTYLVSPEYDVPVSKQEVKVNDGVKKSETKSLFD